MVLQALFGLCGSLMNRFDFAYWCSLRDILVEPAAVAVSYTSAYEFEKETSEYSKLEDYNFVSRGILFCYNQLIPD